MKTKYLLSLSLFSLVLVFFMACVKDDDFDIPGEVQNIDEPELDGDTISISAVINNLDPQVENDQFTFEGTDQYMVGYVVSSDEGGNFYQELIVQDRRENPTAGIRLALESNPLFTKYQIGQKIYVRLNGFTVGTSNGVFALGIPDGNFLGAAPSSFEQKIVRSPQVDSIIALPLEISEFSDRFENLFIALENVQFTREAVIQNEKTFAAEPLDEFDGLRTVESCHSNNSTILSTSTFADFKSLALPQRSGSIRGVLSRTFEDDAYVVKINAPSNLIFEGERCDPVLIDCGTANRAGTEILFSDDFEEQSTNNPISGKGWTNFAEAGSRLWNAFSDSDNTPSMGIGASIGAYQSNEESNIAWLITPSINFDRNTRETLTFETSNSFADNSSLRILFSNNWDGVPESIPSADWSQIDAAKTVRDEANFRAVVESGIIDLSCVEGTGYIAFKYSGSGEGNFDGTFELNDVLVAGE